MSRERHENEENCFVDGYLSPSEQIVQLEAHVKNMKEEIKQLKKLEKHKEKIEKLEHEKKKIISKNLKKHHGRHH
jgi:hypothetical protein